MYDPLVKFNVTQTELKNIYMVMTNECYNFELNERWWTCVVCVNIVLGCICGVQYTVYQNMYLELDAKWNYLVFSTQLI